MIIFGWRGVTMAKTKGQFHCPHCDANKRFKHQRVRRFFTLYFIPVIPLNLLGEYVECGSCKRTYELGVLEYDPAAEQAAWEAQFHVAVRRVMVLMLLADGVVDDDEIAAVRKFYHHLTEERLSAEQVRAEIAEAQRDGRDVYGYLGGMAGNLNDHGKELVVRGAYMVATADGYIQDEELLMFEQIQEALIMTPAHIRGVMAELEKAPQR